MLYNIDVKEKGMITVGELFELAAAAKEGKKIEVESVTCYHGYYDSKEIRTTHEVDFLSLSLEDLLDEADTDNEGLGDTYHVEFRIKDDTKKE